MIYLRHKRSVCATIPPPGGAWISLGRDKFALVDSVRFDELSQWNWFCAQGYAARVRRKNELPGAHLIHMHRVVCGSVGEIDHINRNRLDNRKENLRIVTRSLNMANTDIRSTNRSGYKGVSFDSSRGLWRAAIVVNGKQKMKRFETAERAALYYDEMAREAFGDHAVLNFPLVYTLDRASCR